MIDFRRCFSATTARAIARIAGAHLWCRSGDIIYADNRLVAIHAATAGDKHLMLPKPQRVTDLYTGQVISARASEVTSTLSRGETLLAGLD